MKFNSLKDAEAAMIVAVGGSLSAWQSVESSLFLIYLTASRTFSTQSPIGIIYNAIMQLNIKISITDALIKNYIPSDHHLMTEWTNIKNKLSKRKRVRDKIAHWQIYTQEVHGHAVGFFAPTLPEIISGGIDLDEPPDGAMSANDLIAHSERFGDLGVKIREFYSRLVKELPPESS